MFKKIICLGLALTLLFSFTACKKEEAPDGKEDEPKQLGTFYDLQEAYDEGFLTQEDIRSIRYYLYNGTDDEGYTPIPKNPEVLSAETEKTIKETRAYRYRQMTTSLGIKIFPDATANGFTITRYLGTYNDCVAAILEDSYSDELCVISEEPEIIIAGVTFTYGNPGNIIWKAK